MEKKLLTGAIASAVALAGTSPTQALENPRQGLDNPLDFPECSWDESGFRFSWHDPNEYGDGNDPTKDYPTKYLKDAEFPAWLIGVCDFRGTFAAGLLTEDIAYTYAYWFGTAYEMVDVEELSEYCYGVGPEDAVNCVATATTKQINSAVADAAWREFGELVDECYALVVCTDYVCDDYLAYCTEGVEYCTDYSYVCEGYVIDFCADYAYECYGLGAFAIDGQCYACDGDFAATTEGDFDCYTCVIPDDAYAAYKGWFGAGWWSASDDCAYCMGDRVVNGVCYEFDQGVLKKIDWVEAPAELGWSKVADSIDYCADYAYACNGAYDIYACDDYTFFCTDYFYECADGGYVCDDAYVIADLGKPRYDEEFAWWSDSFQAEYCAAHPLGNVPWWWGETPCYEAVEWFDQGWNDCFTWSNILEDYVWDGEPDWKCNAGYAFALGELLTDPAYYMAEASVKEGNPGLKRWQDGLPRTRGGGRQNWEKVYAECPFEAD